MPVPRSSIAQGVLACALVRTLYTSETLPPRPFDPVGGEFGTGSISHANAAGVQALTFPRDNPLRPFYVHDRPDGTTQCALNTTLLHGVRASLTLRDTDDPARARAASNPDNAPHLSFIDFGGYGYSTVRASQKSWRRSSSAFRRRSNAARATTAAGCAIRVIHRVARWAPGERPEMRREVAEGDAGLAI